MAFPGGGGGGGGAGVPLPQFPGGGDPSLQGMSDQERQMVKLMQTGMESCAGKTAMAGVMGGGLGMMFGLFMASMRYDTPMSQPLPTSAVPPAASTVTKQAATTTASNAAKSTVSSTATSTATSTLTHPPQFTHPPTTTPSLTDLPLRTQLRAGLRDMYRSSLSSGRNFAIVGSVFSGTECCIEGLRAKNDIWNGIWGGCITGGVLARKAGPQAVAAGCVGFAAFSAAIEGYMRMEEEERSRPIA